MFDTATRDSAPFPLSPLPELQFVSVQIMPTDDGLLSVSVMGNFLDQLRLEFMSGDIDDAKVSTIDEALIVIRRALANALPPTLPKEGH
jgi:hypothetical protein